MGTCHSYLMSWGGRLEPTFRFIVNAMARQLNSCSRLCMACWCISSPFLLPSVPQSMPFAGRRLRPGGAFACEAASVCSRAFACSIWLCYGSRSHVFPPQVCSHVHGELSLLQPVQLPVCAATAWAAHEIPELTVFEHIAEDLICTVHASLPMNESNLCIS